MSEPDLIPFAAMSRASLLLAYGLPGAALLIALIALAGAILKWHEPSHTHLPIGGIAALSARDPLNLFHSGPEALSCHNINLELV
jgi:hypothetical protein